MLRTCEIPTPVSVPCADEASGVRWILGPDMAFGVEGALREAGNDNAAEHEIGFKLTARF